jgi:hypothetical protein
MDLSPSREVVSYEAIQELPSILWNPDIHYRVHKNTPLLPFLSHINAANTTAHFLS